MIINDPFAFSYQTNEDLDRGWCPGRLEVLVSRTSLYSRLRLATALLQPDARISSLRHNKQSEKIVLENGFNYHWSIDHSSLKRNWADRILLIDTQKPKFHWLQDTKLWNKFLFCYFQRYLFSDIFVGDDNMCVMHVSGASLTPQHCW